MILALAGICPEESRAQRAGGLWIEAGFGGGWNLVPGLDDGSTPNAAGYLRVGGSPAKQLLLGAEMFGWRRASEVSGPPGNYIFSAFNVGVTALYYPISGWPAYVKGGIGASAVDLSVDANVGFQVSSHHTGIGTTLGAGVDVALAGRLVMSPGVQWSGQFFGTQSNLRRIEKNGFLVLTLGVRWQ